MVICNNFVVICNTCSNLKELKKGFITNNDSFAYQKLRQSVITKYSSSFITNYDKVLTNCYRCYILRQLLQMSTAVTIYDRIYDCLDKKNATVSLLLAEDNYFQVHWLGLTTRSFVCY